MCSRACAVLILGAFLLQASAAGAQDTSVTPNQPQENRVEQTVKVLGGAVLGLALHESGHLTFDLLFGASPGIKRVSYAGIPFFAITHEPTSPAREFAISSAGFWMQHASSEILLSRRPRLRYERAPMMKGLLAFNVLTSVMYSGAALRQTGPAERDTRGMAVSLGVAEPWIAPVILAPAVFDTIRYFKPESNTAKWVSRAAKIGGVLLVFKARS
jgi:hypothetical protein